MGKIKYVKVSYFKPIKSPIHIVEGFEIRRTSNFVQPLSEFKLTDNIIKGNVGDRMTIEIIEMTEAAFKKLRLWEGHFE